MAKKILKQRQVHTSFGVDGGKETETALCPFCHERVVGVWNHNPMWLSLQDGCEHFTGFVEGHRAPAAMFNGFDLAEVKAA